MARLWEVMTETYGHRWTAHYGQMPNRTWVAKLKNVPLAQIHRGVEKDCRREDDWPPSLPAFIALCRGSYEDFGMLDPEAAYQAAGKREYQDPGVFEAVQQIGGAYDFQRMKADKAKPAFQKAYANALERLRAGQKIRMPPQADPDAPKLGHDDAPTERDLEYGKKVLADIRAKLGQTNDKEEQSE